MNEPDEIDEDRIISELNVNSGLDNIFKIFYNDAWNEGYSIGLGNKEPEIRSDYELKKCREIKQQLLALKSKWEAKIEKAYGGCRNCYGKGYSTYNDQTIGYPDFPGDKGFKTNNHRIIFCDCSRGKQLEAEINQLTSNGDKR